MPSEVSIVKVTTLAVVKNITNVRIDLIVVIAVGDKAFIYLLWMLANLIHAT
jgi:hypothetical protein